MFRERFKYYKSKWTVPDFKDVIDFESESDQTVNELILNNCQTLGKLPPGLQPLHTWRCFNLPNHPGLIIVRNAFTAHGQRYWIARSLKDFPHHPNVVNLNDKLFSQPVIEDWWTELQKCEDKNEARRMKIGLRWATLGYHHDWNTKVYNENMRGTFPTDLGQLCSFFAKVLDFEKFNAEAAIVNYYPIGTTLSGHTDHSEQNLTAPLFSLSFGQTAIFLIGGKSIEEKPSAIFLQSGDLLIMSQEARLCYHAVPRIMKTQKEPWNENIAPNCAYLPNGKKVKTDFLLDPTEWNINATLFEKVIDETFWMPYRNYLNDSRININVRQVLNEGSMGLS
ncbi:nucleic acid dioxygenase ALKBH1 [Teleopsis dalmanni]|uniref:nucleic acid dioxygenase ALKBH1 n=1 Tax=Teleopsis dalmanni TaxID=139649 RepID=UPI0018CD2869|nr:nucleic acid dioxygenase ALKBH1 [Teleopsis dalmanni]